MSEGFTPGPWGADLDDLLKGNDFLIFGNREGNNAETDVAIVLGNKVGNRSEANAHLIAAAPELFGALTMLTSIAPGSIPSAVQKRQVAQALAKARGEA